MRRPRRKPHAPSPPPVPRADVQGRRAEIEIFDAAFAEKLWRRPPML